MTIPPSPGGPRTTNVLIIAATAVVPGRLFVANPFIGKTEARTTRRATDTADHTAVGPSIRR